MKKELLIETLKNGCIIQTSHNLNQDGYFRKCVNGKMIMYHRYMWEEKNGKIPEGYEVDHKCKNRACFNVEHLQLLKATKHRSKDNRMRYRDRYRKAFMYWDNNPTITGTSLADLFGVSFGQGCKWIRSWKLVPTIR